jgi:hypothetical protein
MGKLNDAFRDYANESKRLYQRQGYKNYSHLFLLRHIDKRAYGYFFFLIVFVFKTTMWIKNQQLFISETDYVIKKKEEGSFLRQIIF